jgi:hypothetical protein
MRVHESQTGVVEMSQDIAEKAKTIEVTVRYAAAPAPYHEKHASADEALATLKASALKAFGLTEGSATEGGTFTYKLFHKKNELSNLSLTLGQVAGHDGSLELKLSQEIKQGGSMECAAR